MITREARAGNARIGFEILSLNDDRRGWLAHQMGSTGPRVGKYYVNLKDLDGVGVSAILRSVEVDDIVAIDEIGPMELYSDNFKRAVGKALKSRKLVIATIHWSIRALPIEGAEDVKNARVFEVTAANRKKLHNTIAEEIRRLLDKGSPKE